MAGRHKVIVATVVCVLTAFFDPGGRLSASAVLKAALAASAPAKAKADTFVPTSVRKGAGVPSAPNIADKAQRSQAQEMVEKRTRNSATFKTAAGFEAYTYPTSYHYLGPSGKWQRIDDTLVASKHPGYAAVNRANSYQAFFPTNLARTPVLVEYGPFSVSFTLDGASGEVAYSENQATYAGALASTVVHYQALPDGLKETLILQSKAAPSMFTWVLGLAGVSAAATGDGAVTLRDNADQLRMEILPPTVVDSAGTKEAGAHYVLSQTGGHARLALSLDAQWLNDPERVWPVLVDPTVVLSYDGISIVKTFNGANTDCQIQSGSGANTNSCTTTTLSMGYNGTSIYRSLAQFNTQIPTDSIILKADLAFYLDSTAAATAVPVELHTLTQTWTSGVTWNTRDGTNAWTTAGGTFNSTPTWTTNVGTANGWYHWYLASPVQGWTDTSTVNNGLLLKVSNEASNGLLKVRSSDYVNSSFWPYLKVTYQLALGERPWYRLQGRQLDDRLQLHANVGSGNMLLKQTLVKLRGTGLDENLTLFYNNLAPNAWDFGRSWVLNTGWDVWLRINDGDGVSLYGPSGWAAHFLQNPDGSYGTPAGADATLTHNGDGTWSVVFNDSQEKLTFTSDGFSLLTDADRNGNHHSFAYDANGALSSITDTQGRVTTFSYVAGGSGTCGPPTNSGFVGTITDPSGRRHSFTYDTNCNLLTYTDPKNQVTRFGYDANTNLTKVTDPAGHVTNLTFDGNFRLTSVTYVTNPSAGTGLTTSFAYATGTTTVTDANTGTTTHYPDVKDRITKTVDQVSRTSQASYTGDNKLATVTDTAGQQTQMAYSARNDPISVSKPGGVSISAAYGDSSHPDAVTSATDASGATTSYTYTPAGNVSTVTDGMSRVTTYTYNANGTIASIVNPANNTISYGYDLSGNLTSVSYPAPLGTVRYAYDALSRLTGFTNGRNQTTTYSYDALDRVTQIQYADLSTVMYGYDSDGNKVSVMDATGTTTVSYDLLNRETGKTLPGNRSISYTYDNNDNLLTKIDQGGTEARTYDAANQLTSIKDPTNATTSLGYDSAGHLSSLTYPNGVVESYTYGSAGQLTQVQAKTGSGSILTSFTHSYTNPANQTASGLRYSVTDMSGNVTSYTYDAANHLTASVKTAPGGGTLASYNYSYDPLGNITSKTVNGVVTNYSYNAANELTSDGTSSYTYDGDGNMTAGLSGSSLTYNAAGQTTSISPSGGVAVSMSYADVGQAMRTQAGSTTYQYDRSGLSVIGGNTYIESLPNGSAFELRTGGASYWYLHDGLGSIVGLTNTAGAVVNQYSYEPYGKAVQQVEQVPNPIRWKGALWDSATNLYKMGMRYYSADLGRFTQTDVVRSINRFTYANGDPINQSDPSGALSIVWWWWWGWGVSVCWWWWCWWAYAEYGQMVVYLSDDDIKGILGFGIFASWWLLWLPWYVRAVIGSVIWSLWFMSWLCGYCGAKLWLHYSFGPWWLWAYSLAWWPASWW